VGRKQKDERSVKERCEVVMLTWKPEETNECPRFVGSSGSGTSKRTAGSSVECGGGGVGGRWRKRIDRESIHAMS
jgi:hypothetical protein